VSALTIGHILLLFAVIAAFVAVVNTATALKYGRGRTERGTPQYARARMARRTAFYALGLALLFALLCITPLCSIVILDFGG
jgi:hypothetical protein